MASKHGFVAAACASFLVFSGSVLADPVGTYAVTGANPGGGEPYSGTVSIERTGETYAVVWKIGEATFTGVGIGASRSPTGDTTFGRASPNDNVLSIGYVSQGSFGQALYVESGDGSWSGVWAFGGATNLGTESWTKN